MKRFWLVGTAVLLSSLLGWSFFGQESTVVGDSVDAVEESTSTPIEQSSELIADTTDEVIISGNQTKRPETAVDVLSTGIIDCSSRLYLNDRSRHDAVENIAVDSNLIIAQFAHVNTLEAQLSYTLGAKLQDIEHRFDSLLDFNQQFPDNPIALALLIESCASIKQPQRCDNVLIDQAIAIHQDNGQFWLSLAALYLKRQQQDLALAALVNVEQASYFEDYRIQVILNHLNALEAVEGLNTSTITFGALSHGIEKPRISRPIINFCANSATKDTSVTQLCLSVGQQLEQQSQSFEQRYAGQKLQMQYWQEIGDVEQELVVKSRQKVLRSDRRPKNEKRLEKAFVLALLNRNLLRGWLENIQGVGESEARQRLIVRAQQYSATHGEQACGVGNEIGLR